MAKYNKVYRGQFSNQEVDYVTNLSSDVVIVVDIYDTASGEADEPTEIIPLEMAGQPVLYESIDNEEDKFTVIRSIRALVKIHSSDTIGIETFYSGGDTTFYVEIYVLNPQYYFIKGFLSTGDLEEDFQPDPNVITLTVGDGLGFLADEELTDEDGNTISGVHNIWYYIRLALLKTGHSLNSRVVFNIREKFAPTPNGGDSEAGHFLNYCYLDAKTFEGENAGTMITCREVLERILYGCFLTQYYGEWFIVSIDEMQGDALYNLFTVNQNGIFSHAGGFDYSKEIGEGLALSWMNDDALVSSERPLKKLDVKRIFEYFKEIPCNVDFERGTGSDPTGAADETIDYTPECWDFLREGTDNVDLDSAPFGGSVGLLRKNFVFSYEKERYLVIQQAGGFRHYFKSEGIRMGLLSKIDIAVNYRFNTNDSDDDATINLLHIRLLGDSGQIYDLNLTVGETESTWSTKDATDPVFNDTIQDHRDPHHFTDWKGFSFTTAPAPEEGTLYIRLLQALASPTQINFNGLRVNYIPQINGTYAKFTGESHLVEQEANTKANKESELFIGSGPDVNIKGVLQKRGENREIFTGTVTFGNSHQFELSGDHRAALRPYIGQIVIIAGSTLNDQETKLVSLNYSIIGNLTQVFFEGDTVIEFGVPITLSVATFQLAELFYASQVLPDGPFEDAQSKPYGENVAFNIWNQYNRVMVKFEGTVDGLQTNTLDTPPHFIHKYTLADADPLTGTRIFMLLHFAQDLHLCQWNTFFHEVHDPAKGKTYIGHSFKYLTE
jgi:hypothetical protein